MPAGKELAVFEHGGEVTQVGFSSDGRYAVSGNDTGIRVWRLPDPPPGADRPAAPTTAAAPVVAVGVDGAPAATQASPASRPVATSQPPAQPGPATVAGRPTTAAAPPAPPVAVVAGPVPESRQGVPTAAEVAAATDEVRAALRKEYAYPSAATKLAAALLGRLPQENKPAVRYVCCTEAYDLACKAGDPVLAMGAVDSLRLLFDDAQALPMAMAVLTPLAQKPPAPDACAPLLQQAAETYLLALARDDKEGREAAEKLVPVLRLLAARARPPSTPGLVELLKEGNLFARRSALGRQALQRLGAAPADAAANKAAGRWLCFGARRWDEGLAYLGRGGNPELRKLAALEAQAPDARTQLEVAKEWALLPTRLGLKTT